MPDSINQNTRIKLKELAGVDNLSAAQIDEVLHRSAQWIANFYSESAGDEKVKGDFTIEGFSYGGEFDLSTAQDILNRIAPPTGKVPFLFLSDLVNFVEQIRTSLSNGQIFISSTQRVELDKLGNTFNLIGISLIDDNQITIADLQRIEYLDNSRKIVERIKLIYSVLKPSIDAQEIKNEEKLSESDTENVSLNLASLPSISKKTADDSSSDGGDSSNQEEVQESPITPQPLKISTLEPEARFYIQALSIITINQALSKYFNAESLAKFGLPPGLEITFDQLPLNVRAQLMDRAFLQVESLLLSREYSLDELIKNQSQRINFSNRAALYFLMDIHALKLLNDCVREIAQRGMQAEKVAVKNAQKQLTKEDLSDRIKNATETTEEEVKNILSTKQAQEFVEKGGEIENFAQAIASQLNIVNTEKELDEIFSRKIAEIINENNGEALKDSVKLNLIVSNVKPLIEVFIQQGLPPEYLIPDPKNFDYNRFVNVFGKSLGKDEFNKQKEELANLIAFYWKRKRAIWAREIREEFAQERYTPEEAQKLYEKIKKDPKKTSGIRELGTLNLVYGGRKMAEELAGKTEAANTVGLADKNGLAAELERATKASAAAKAMAGNKEAESFAILQKQMVDDFLKQHAIKLGNKNQQETIEIYATFYTPQAQTAEFTIETFQDQIVPQINPMDLYALQAAEAFGAGAFAKDGSGYIQQAFAPGANYHNTGLMDGAFGKKNNELATKAVSEGLYHALNAAGGWGEALRAAETAIPFIKKLKESIISSGIEKVVNFGKKNWIIILPGTILVAFFPALLLLIPAYLLFKNALGGIGSAASGVKKLFSGGEAGTGLYQGASGMDSNAIALSKATTYGQSTGQLAAGAKAATSQIASSAMITAGQAVITTIGVTVGAFYICQTSLNSAFLTDFPATESSVTGENSLEKTSRYAEISKTAVITDGCANPENNGAKCENPSFPVSIEYTVTIKPKEDFSIQITNIEDVTTFKQNREAWEEIGQPPPSIQYQRVHDFAYFKEIIKEQGGLSSESIIVTPVTDPEIQPIETDVTPPITEEIVIPAGGSLTFTYTIDGLSADYNNTAIINVIEVNFYYQNNVISGTDNVITAARVCLGNCSAGAGCWPTTGNIWQLPFGPLTHGAPGNSNNSWGDSYDVGCDSCTGAATYGPPVYARFDGNLCFKGCDDNQYGCRYILEFQSDGQTLYEDYAHFQEPNPAISTPNTCMQVEAGFMIALMSNRGTGSVHLHWGVVANAGGGWWSSRPAFSLTEQLVPETDNGNFPAKLNDHVTTCYE